MGREQNSDAQRVEHLVVKWFVLWLSGLWNGVCSRILNALRDNIYTFYVLSPIVIYSFQYTHIYFNRLGAPALFFISVLNCSKLVWHTGWLVAESELVLLYNTSGWSGDPLGFASGKQYNINKLDYQ